jgi:hypothetical protein
MSQENEQETNDEMRVEYDFSGGVRGKYYQAFTQSSNIIILDPDVAEVFRDSASVNEALRLLAKIAKSVST